LWVFDLIRCLTMRRVAGLKWWLMQSSPMLRRSSKFANMFRLQSEGEIIWRYYVDTIGCYLLSTILCNIEESSWSRRKGMFIFMPQCVHARLVIFDSRSIIIARDE
jgi:hypothetical protein